MDPFAVCCSSNESQTEETTISSSQTLGQALLSSSNSNTEDPSIPGSTTTTTTLPSDVSAGIPLSTPSVMPAYVTTGTSIPDISSTTTPLPSNASAVISIPSCSSTPTSLPSNASTGVFIPGTASTANTLPLNALVGIPVPSGASTPLVMPTNVTTGTAMPIPVQVGVSATPYPVSRLLAYNELPQEEIDRHLNIYAAQVLIPNRYCKILEWGCLKNQSETFYDYLRDTKNLNHTQLKKKYNISGEEDLEKLKHVDTSRMDGPLMRKVIQAACEGLKDVDDGVWKEKDESKTECLMAMLNESRNKVCHEIKTAAISSEMFDEIIHLLEKLIQVGGKLYQQPSTEIDKELNELQQNIDIVRTTKTIRELIALQHLFHTTGYSETKIYWKNYCTQDIHLFSNVLTTHADVFYPLDVLPKSSNTHNRSMSHEKMFDCTGVEDYRPVLILEGEAGSGKSTILKQIAMQFFNLTKNSMPSLNEFHLLHFLQCSNQSFKDLAAFIMSYFSEVCKIVSPEDALRGFPYLGNLILIDGYDEINSNSVRVTKQFIETYKKNPACQIMFTARPCAVPELEDLLNREGVQFNIYQLLEISQKEKQLEFLKPFDRDSGLCRSFSDLAPGVKNFFVRPINLIQFYSLFLDSPDKVQKWKSINEVMRDIMSQYETLLTSKLKHRGIHNLKQFIKGILQRLCDFAFEGLIKRTFTLDELACEQLSDYCFEKIEKWGLMSQLDTNHILSAVYVTKETATKNAVPTYQYSHESMQELMSARSLLSDLTLNQTLTLEELIRTRIQNLNEKNENVLMYDDVKYRVENVYKFVLMIFSDPDKRPLLLRWLPQLETALTSAGVDWQDVMMSCDRPAKTKQDEVAKIAAEKKLTASRKWRACTARDVMAIARMLPHAQPDELDVQLPESEGTPSELATILQMFTGDLRLEIHHSYDTYTNCDRIVDELNSSCSVLSLTGCLASSSVSTRSLSLTLQQPGARLDLSLENPSSHALRELQGTEHILNVRMKHHNSSTARPLPRGFLAPLLIVEDTPDSGAEELRAAILHYAPEGGVYFSLWLENTLLNDAAIQRLLNVLHRAGIRTSYNCRGSCFIVVSNSSDGLCLHCRKSHTHGFDRCVWLQLADEMEEEGGEEPWPGWCDFEAAKALKKDKGRGNLYPIGLDDLIVPDVVKRVIDWGCQKPASMTFLDYMSERKRKSEHHLDMRERQMLNVTVLQDGFDVNLLYKLIPLVCEYLEFSDIHPWEGASCSTVEGLLRDIMDARNNFSHNPEKVEVFMVKVPYIEDLCTKLIIATGKLYSINKNLVKKEVTTTRCNFFKIARMDPSAVCCRSNESQTEAPTDRLSQTSGQALLSASNSNTTDPPMPTSTSTITTLLSNASARIPISAPPVIRETVTTETSIPGTTSTITTLPSNASAGISMPSSASTPYSLPTNASTGLYIPGTASTANTRPSNASLGNPMLSGTSTSSVMPTNVTTGTSMPIPVPFRVTATPSPASRLLAYNELPQEEIDRHLNIYAVQVLIPSRFRRILELGCLKNQSETFYDYLRNTKKLNHTQLKKKYNLSGEDDLEKMKHVDSALMDGPLLCKVILATCEKLKDVSDDVWKGNDEGKTECLITMLNKCCNMVCHEEKTSAISSKMFDKIIQLLEKLIQAGGKLYQQPSTEIDKELNELRQNIDTVRTSKSTRDLIALKHLFQTTGYSETVRYWKNYCTQDIHLFSNTLTTHADDFYPLDVLLKSSDKDNRPMPHEKMFDCTGVDEYRPVLILEGEAGSGKSTILNQIAMQFFNFTENKIPSLKDFHLLHFLQCNNKKIDDLKAFIMSYFPETCQIVPPDDALRCLPCLENLILIDGYDEININSVRVTKQFIETYKKNPACQIVFTARPCAVPDLKDLLRREEVQFKTYQLLGISQEEKQLEFLRPLDRDSGLCRVFSALTPGVKNLFVRPIHLKQFCSLFLDSPDRVRERKTIKDIMRDNLSQYETLLASKLKHHGIKNLEQFINEVLQRLCDFAFEGLIKRTFTLNELACEELSDYCFEIIEKWGIMSQVDTNQILSVVYVTKVTPTSDAMPTYQYFHKSMQELMSARSLLKDLTLNQTMTLEELIRSRIRNLNERNEDMLMYDNVTYRLLNVYKFVLMIFSDPPKRPHLLRWLPQLETALTSARADWQDVMMSCDRPSETEQDEVAKIAAEKKLTASRKWTACTARDVMAIARMLPHAQPDELDVQLPESEGTPSELATILQMFTGHLRLEIHHSYETYTNCDRIVDELNSSCSVLSLTGCLASSSVSTRSLSSTLQQPGARLDLSLENPSSHALQELQGTMHILNVRMKHHNPPTARPLPRGFLPPLLIVEGTPASGAEELRTAILHYAPEGGVYFSLGLENTLLDDAAIHRLLNVLHRAGIRTCHHRRKSCFTVAGKSSGRLCLHCRKTHTDASQRCMWLQLADERKEDGGEETWLGLRDFKAAKALEKDGDQENLNQLNSDDLIRFTCYDVVQVIVPNTMKKVIDWGCRKPASMTFLDYISDRKCKFKHHINIRDRRMLNVTLLHDNFDVALLYKLITLVCENLEFSDIHPREKASCSTVEGLLRDIKNATNDVCHNPKAVAVAAHLSRPRYLEDLCTKLIIAAGKMYSINMNLVEYEVTTIRCNFFKSLQVDASLNSGNSNDPNQGQSFFPMELLTPLQPSGSYEFYSNEPPINLTTEYGPSTHGYSENLFPVLSYSDVNTELHVSGLSYPDFGAQLTNEIAIGTSSNNEFLESEPTCSGVDMPLGFGFASESVNPGVLREVPLSCSFPTFLSDNEFLGDSENSDSLVGSETSSTLLGSWQQFQDRSNENPGFSSRAESRQTQRSISTDSGAGGSSLFSQEFGGETSDSSSDSKCQDNLASNYSSQSRKRVRIPMCKYIAMMTPEEKLSHKRKMGALASKKYYERKRISETQTRYKFDAESTRNLDLQVSLARDQMRKQLRYLDSSNLNIDPNSRRADGKEDDTSK